MTVGGMTKTVSHNGHTPHTRYRLSTSEDALHTHDIKSMQYDQSLLVHFFGALDDHRIIFYQFTIYDHDKKMSTEGNRH